MGCAKLIQLEKDIIELGKQIRKNECRNNNPKLCSMENDILIKATVHKNNPKFCCPAEERPRYIKIPLSVIQFQGVGGSADGASNAFLQEIIPQIEEKIRSSVRILVNADSIIK